MRLRFDKVLTFRDGRPRTIDRLVHLIDSLIILSVVDAFEATRWIAELARPASPARAEERDQAHHRLKNLWQKTSETIKGDNVEKLKEEKIS